MSDVDVKLTREEVDALLDVAEELGTTAPADSAATPTELYYFHRPDTISKYHERTLGLLYTSFARNLSGTLSTLSRGIASVAVSNSAEMEYQQFTRKLPGLSLMAICSMPPLVGKLLVAFDPFFSLIMVDRLLGGPGQAPREPRGLTEIEVALMGQVVVRVLGSLQESLESVIDVRPSLDQLEPNAGFVQLVSATTRVIGLRLDVTVRAAKGGIQVCIPMQMLKPILPVLHEHFWMRGKRMTVEDVQAAPEIRRIMHTTPVMLSVELGTADITLSDLLELSIGDCVVLGSRESEDLVVKVAGRHHIWGQLGVFNHKYAVEITRWHETDEPDESTERSDKP